MNNKTSISAYIGISYLTSKIEAIQTTPLLDIISKEKLELNGFGPKFGLQSNYKLSRKSSLLGGIETGLYSVDVKDYTSASADGNSPYILNYKLNHKTLLPMISGFVAGQYSLSKNINLQIGVRSTYTFDFTTNGYMGVYASSALTNTIGWSEIYSKLSINI